MLGFIGKMLGGGVGNGVAKIAGVVDKFVETPDEKRAAEIVLRKLEERPNEVQAEINKVEAGHRSLFVAGARPFLLWVCGAGFAVSFIVNPVLQWITNRPVPTMPVGIMMELTLGILGLAGLRTYEKLKGLTK